MSSLKDYLKRYTGGTNDDSSGKSKKSKKKRKASEPVVTGAGVVIVDDDVAWQKDSKPDYDDGESPEAGEEQPAVVEDVEVKRMLRMEALKTFRPYLAVADDGSGWVTVRDDALKPASTKNLSPPQKKNGSENNSRIVPPFPRERYDSPDETRHRTSTAVYNTNGSRDLSPPRKKLPIREMAREAYPLQKKNDSASVSSPEKRRHDSPDETPGRTARSDDTSLLRVRRTSTNAPDTNELPDLSPPRKKIPVRDPAEAENVSTLVSSWDRRRHLPRPRDSPEAFLGRTAKSEDSSPPISRRASTAGRATIESRDLSPPRRKYSNRESAQESSSLQRRNDSTFLSPGDKRRHDSLDDLRRKSDNSSRVRKTPSAAPDKNERQDLSPKRKKLSMRDNTQDDYTLVTARDTRGRNFPDASRRKTAMSDDSSPPMASRTPTLAPDTIESRALSPPREKLTRRMADGAFAGLKTEREVVSEAERKKADEDKFLSDLDPSLSGRGAKTVFRDKRGRRLEGLEEMLRQQRSEVKPAEEPLEWGKGVAQKREIAAKLAELEAEKNKPFARYRDDAELDKSLKERIRWGDPMAHLVKRKAEEPVLEDFGAREEMKASGFIIPQDIPNHSWLKRGVAAPPNRYGIKPGRHWDGVDRSTGFEQGLCKQKNEKKARELEAYLWSVSDM